MKLLLSDDVSTALVVSRGIVALESTVISHGLPYPKNIETAKSLEKIVRDGGAIPATIAAFGGEFCVGLNAKQLEHLANSRRIRKISRRDLAIAAARKEDCATTVASTAFLAHRAGIKVFATGGIGGIHRGDRTDVSADLPELAQTPIVVVCSGAKIVLDLPATREWLETYGVTVLGWQCDEFPAFYSRSSGLTIDQQVECAADVARIAYERDELGLKGSVLVCVPVPEEHEIASDRLEEILEESLAAAVEKKITGKELTPFLLNEMSEKSGGQTTTTNIALLENNARVAAQIANDIATY